MSALSESPAQLYTMHEAPTPDNAASAYPPEDSCENMTPEQAQAKKQEYARNLFRFHKSMAGPAGNEDKQRRDSADSGSSAGSVNGDIH